MPLYDYECEKCNNIQEEYHRMSETPKIICKKCKSIKMHKVMSVAQINMNTWHGGSHPDEVV